MRSFPYEDKRTIETLGLTKPTSEECGLEYFPQIRRLHTLLRKPDGTPLSERDDQFVWDRGEREFVCVVPYHTDANRKNSIFMMFEPKFAVGDILLMFPGGEIKSDENPAEAARREIEEEIGLRVSAVSPLSDQTFVEFPDKVRGGEHRIMLAELSDTTISSQREQKSLKLPFNTKEDRNTLLDHPRNRRMLTHAAIHMAWRKLHE